ncbi:MAG TPA: UvrD-helicase domain-containing protein, partial [Allosphingosinicella sp.]|nr:UvrD-helicase domain-containing protein [Allosphingosinicella sp.]
MRQPPTEHPPQRRAADPATSAWVSANAGSGKTFVLVNRAIRLMLAGTLPQRILCLTYTVAAATEMSRRLFEQLGHWIALDDKALARDIRDLDGDSDLDVDLGQARRLFARALDTPGGLKIQTIHA